MIDVEDWAEVRRLHRAEGMSIKVIGRRVGVARDTVREALRSTEPPRYQRPGTGSLVDVVEPAIRGLLGEFPSMPATVIAERIGWAHGMTILKERVRELRPLFQPPDGCQRTFYRPGELAQWDLWQPDIAIPVGHGQEAKQWTVVGVAGFSRLIGGWMVCRHARRRTYWAGWVRSSASSGAVPRMWVWDQEACIGRWTAGHQRLTEEFQAFRGGYGAIPPPPKRA